MTWSPRSAWTRGSPSPKSPGSAPVSTRSSARSEPRRLDHIEFPYVYLATYLHVRNQTSQVCSLAAVVATGITADGSREVLGVDVGDSEDEVFWRVFLRSLKVRGLGGVRLVRPAIRTTALSPAHYRSARCSS
jgi:hypothetical protein